MSMVLVVMEEGDEQRMASFIRDNALAEKGMVLWRLENSVSIRAMLRALEEAWEADPVGTILFPPSIAGDELATRLAWRLNGTAICQILSCDPAATTVTKAVYGNALTATLHTDASSCAIRYPRIYSGQRLHCRPKFARNNCCQFRLPVSYLRQRFCKITASAAIG